MTCQTCGGRGDVVGWFYKGGFNEFGYGTYRCPACRGSERDLTVDQQRHDEDVA